MVECQGSSAENYDLCALGLLEGPEAEELRSHLAAQCEVCWRGIRESLAFWYTFGAAQAAVATGLPPSALKRRVLQSIRRDGASQWGALFLAWPRVAYVAATAGVLTTATWYLVQRARQPGLPEFAEAPSVEALQREAELERWRERAAAAEKSLAERKAAPAPVPPKPEAPSRELEQSLATARAEVASISEALTRERTRAKDLEGQLDGQKIALGSAQRQLEEAEKRAASVPEQVARLATLQRQMAALATRIQELERENARHRETVADLQRQLDRSQRMVAFLNSPGLQMVRLRATQTGRSAAGQAFVIDGQRLVFYASNLPSLPAGRTYQLWVLRGRRPAIVSGGIFSGDLGLRNPLEFADASVLQGVTGLAVTDEPAGGSPGPTGDKFLVGTVRPL